jgi:Family of unknown function (DUF6416)
MSTPSAEPDKFTIPLGPGIELVLHGAAAARLRAHLSTPQPGDEAPAGGAEADPAPGLALPDDHPMWEHHSGGKAYQRREWRPGDEACAMALLMDLGAPARVFLDLLLEQPGRLLDADDLRLRAPAVFTSRRSLAGCMNDFAAPCARFDRRYPFYVWERPGAPARYAVKPSVGRLYHAARQLDIVPDR